MKVLIFVQAEQVWQSQAEIKHYSIADFDCVTAFEAVTHHFRYGWGSYFL